MDTTILNNSEAVTERIQSLEESFAEKVQAVRQVILSADPLIIEAMEYKSPCFYYTGEMPAFEPEERKSTVIEMNLRHNKIILVFPSGAIVKGPTGIFEGSYKDGRRLVPIGDLQDIADKEEMLVSVIKKWIKQLNK